MLLLLLLLYYVFTTGTWVRSEVFVGALSRATAFTTALLCIYYRCMGSI
jgi:hypothetical protein